MQLFVPFAVDRPKTRLSEILSASERREFSRVMLADVLDALAAVSLDGDTPEPTVLATGPIDIDAPVVVDERPLDPAVNDRLDTTPTAIVMADLALATPEALERLLTAPGDLAIAAGLGGGTNAFIARDSAFHVDYHGASYRDHLAIARDAGLAVTEVDSRRLAVDIDESADLTELLLHGEGAARDWLVDAGFELVTTGGRVRATRE
ncbi:MAG: 2-phospho-L-lactate guanylyltransferase [Halolamina sp.]